MVPEDPRRWYALFTKPRQEAKVAGALARRGLDVFYPSYRVHSRKTGRALTRPFFPRYLFVRLDWLATGWVDVQWTAGLSAVVHFEGRPASLDGELVEQWRRRLERLDGDDFVRFKPGERLRVRSGPFRDQEVIFDRHLNGEERVAILIQILGRQTTVQLPADAVVRVA